MTNRNTQNVNTFTFIGAEYEAPASLNENIREWFRHNSPNEPQLNMIPSNVRFSDVKNVLTATTYEELPDWYAALDSVPRDLIYCCVAARRKK